MPWACLVLWCQSFGWGLGCLFRKKSELVAFDGSLVLLPEALFPWPQKSNSQRIIGWNKVVPRLRLAVRAWYYQHDTLATMPITGMRAVLRFHTAIQEAILAMRNPIVSGMLEAGNAMTFRQGSRRPFGLRCISRILGTYRKQARHGRGAKAVAVPIAGTMGAKGRPEVYGGSHRADAHGAFRRCHSTG